LKSPAKSEKVEKATKAKKEESPPEEDKLPDKEIELEIDDASDQ
jgi:hypothetical protein